MPALQKRHTTSHRETSPMTLVYMFDETPATSPLTASFVIGPISLGCLVRLNRINSVACYGLELLLPYFLLNISIVCELEQKMQSAAGFNDCAPLSGRLIIS
jgi:hypothetical protein